MIGKHLLFTLRSFKKNILYAVLVVGGLAIGITTFLSTVQWSAWHLTYDRDYPEAERIYRMTFEEINDGFYRHTARILHGSALSRILFSEQISGVDSWGRLAPFRKAAIIIGEDSYYERQVYACDPGFLSIFAPRFLRGDPEQALHEPHTAIMTRSAAGKYFGDRDPVGATFELIHQFEIKPEVYTVTGIVEDFPGNSHLNISVLTSFINPVEYEGTAWAYLKLSPGADPVAVEQYVKKFLVDNVQDPYTDRIHPRLMPAGRIHLHSHLARELQPNTRFRTVMVMLVTGILVFLLAWFNFTLLSYSQNQLQIRKLVVQWQMGAGRRVFFNQFLTDNLFVGIIALAAGILFTLSVRPAIQSLGGHFIFQDRNLVIASIFLLLLLIIAGSLTTAAISTGRLYRYLQQRYLSSRMGPPPDTAGRNLFVRAVILLEFAVTFVLVSNLLMITRQTRFAMDQ
ncbi:MAG: hypothetical protein EHM46_01770, partial [Bacteroidetes bacterium]